MKKNYGLEIGNICKIRGYPFYCKIMEFKLVGTKKCAKVYLSSERILNPKMFDFSIIKTIALRDLIKTNINLEKSNG